ncbi:MAG: hypothetical protein N2C11_00365 [Planococcus sp. (in: firmicutes)]|uniref:hypothetical protein n=1 Tax=Planococcus halocryophilus TaxID=1215089 RepID=UPI001F11898F|nr:hypothetical protein [Planococcus halocryophilus]MCH4827454.1 hypothetical protein [Planococcus halocryophilus]
MMKNWRIIARRDWMNDYCRNATRNDEWQSVPFGYGQTGKPFGITFWGQAFIEPMLIEYTYAFGQKVKRRRKPKTI